ncbi:MAG: hypothetical protein ING19_21165 [Azospirillum sp.]|nr:hypothetical protein [Azospirillum sp.]MCA3268563.1 hypothetical protein [Azospirillum sp.]
MADEGKCELCGEPMPAGEKMFRYHGTSGPCPKPPKPMPPTPTGSNADEWCWLISECSAPYVAVQIAQRIEALEREREQWKQAAELAQEDYQRMYGNFLRLEYQLNTRAAPAPVEPSEAIIEKLKVVEHALLISRHRLAAEANGDYAATADDGLSAVRAAIAALRAKGGSR